MIALTRVLLLLQVLTKDDPSLWPQCTPNVQVATSTLAVRRS